MKKKSKKWSFDDFVMKAAFVECVFIIGLIAYVVISIPEAFFF